MVISRRQIDHRTDKARDQPICWTVDTYDTGAQLPDPIL